ncbi:hypothetical protein HYC85_030646 [Camellia sinensis]|uniref:FBD domain-containing protein n=1 Tax=Camellia sinensis TaxID=4442 RepID=A0A7J7G2D8_CAMSI|nr:hypothetical protein HYC85_030646 [Camellia sinensis]
MEQLRHLYVPLNFNVKFKFDGLSTLETLGGFDTESCDVNDLCKLINLRQLEDANFWKMHNQDLAAFINYLSIGADHLRQTSLSVQFCKNEEEELTLLKQLLGCHHLYRLNIYGIIPELREYCQGLFPNLIELTLVRCNLEEDPMPTLERLPNLQYLDLVVNIEKHQKKNGKWKKKILEDKKGKAAPEVCVSLGWGGVGWGVTF